MRTLKISGPAEAHRRKGISGVLATVIVLTMIFTVGLGAFIFVNEGAFSSLQAQQGRNQAINQASLERVSLNVSLSKVADPWGQTRDLWFTVSNTGTVSVTLVDVFVTNTTADRILSKSQVTVGSVYLSTEGTLLQKGDLNYSLPVTILPGASTNDMAGCGPSYGCNIAISKSSYSFSGSPVVVSVLTSSGNIFSAQYPPSPSGTVTTETSTTLISETTTLLASNPGGNILVVQMKAEPPQTFSCTHCVNDTVIVSNYGNSSVTNISLTPSSPLVQSTGNVQLTPNGPCALQGGTNSLPAYSGTGLPPSITYLCNYSASPNGFGGFVSFTGAANGTYNLQPVTSGVAISNTIQVGGPVSVLNQGPFSANFFFFKYSACTTKPATGVPCVTAPTPLAFNTLPPASKISGASSYYVAFYVTITNEFNVTLPILPYTYFQTDPTYGGESPFYLVGDPGSLPYIPNYSPGGNEVPVLNPYPPTCVSSSTATCINLAPGKSVTLTFAACDIGSSLWDWAGSSYGTQNGGSACTTNPPNYQPNESTYLSVIITFEYNGQVYTQQIPFVGQTVT